MFATIGINTAVISVLITFFACSIYLFHIQEYQKHMEAFDQNVANVTTWMYRAEILLDESDKQKPQQKEEILKVKKCDFLESINFILKRTVSKLAYFKRYRKLIKILFFCDKATLWQLVDYLINLICITKIKSLQK